MPWEEVRASNVSHSVGGAMYHAYMYMAGAPEPVPQVPRPWDQCWKQNL